jgi:hypothetical protein
VLWKSLIFPQDGQHYSALPLQFSPFLSELEFLAAARAVWLAFFGRCQGHLSPFLWSAKNSGVPGLRLPSLGCLCILTHGQGGGLWLVRGDGSGGIFVSGPDGKARGSGSDLLLAGIFRWPGVGLKVV